MSPRDWDVPKELEMSLLGLNDPKGLACAHEGGMSPQDWNVPSGVGFQPHSPQSQHFCPHPVGSLCYLLEGTVRALSWWHCLGQGHCGCPQGQREAAFG